MPLDLLGLSFVTGDRLTLKGNLEVEVEVDSYSNETGQLVVVFRHLSVELPNTPIPLMVTKCECENESGDETADVEIGKEGQTLRLTLHEKSRNSRSSVSGAASAHLSSVADGSLTKNKSRFG